MVDLMPKWRLLILVAVALASTWAIYGPTLRIALMKDIVDNPEARKLQKRPVPTLGGVVVFFGIAVGLMFFKTMFYQTALLPVLAAMVIMLYVGTMDDIIGIPPGRRLLIEIAVALLLIYGSRSTILNFQGLWGIRRLALGWSIPLTVLTIVGLINAINMIDGVDGLLSGFGILICGFYGLLCFLAHDYSNAALATVTIGALVTFFLHNVFGVKSKMFLGDGGSMLLGILVSWLVISILGGHFHIREYLDGRVDFNLIAFALAVVAIPVADTLRVMTVRIFEGRSPLKPDNNHLHHHFIRCGFSHLATTLSMLGMALLIIGAFLLSWVLGASAEWQLYTVIAVTALLDGGGAWLLGRLEKKGARVADRPEKSGFWMRIQNRMDKGIE
jgi:UDP-N-acetylmuramyl pentapeptide phosphotransferase/UDP-N-acetylglucosamine-1-phosphate transferase